MDGPTEPSVFLVFLLLAYRHSPQSKDVAREPCEGLIEARRRTMRIKHAPVGQSGEPVH